MGTDWATTAFEYASGKARSPRAALLPRVCLLLASAGHFRGWRPAGLELSGRRDGIVAVNLEGGRYMCVYLLLALLRGARRRGCWEHATRGDGDTAGSLLSSSSLRTASWTWRGTMRFFLLSRAARRRARGPRSTDTPRRRSCTREHRHPRPWRGALPHVAGDAPHGEVEADLAGNNNATRFHGRREIQTFRGKHLYFFFQTKFFNFRANTWLCAWTASSPSTASGRAPAPLSRASTR